MLPPAPAAPPPGSAAHVGPPVVAPGWPLSALPTLLAGVGAQPPGERHRPPTTPLTWDSFARPSRKPGRPVLPVLVRRRLPTQLQAIGGGRRPSSSLLPSSSHFFLLPDAPEGAESQDPAQQLVEHRLQRRV